MQRSGSEVSHLSLPLSHITHTRARTHARKQERARITSQQHNTRTKSRGDRPEHVEVVGEGLPGALGVVDGDVDVAARRERKRHRHAVVVVRVDVDALVVVSGASPKVRFKLKARSSFFILKT